MPDATQTLKVLDAGCGRNVRLFDVPDAYVVGLDVDEAALALNNQVDEKIVGDIQTYPLPAGAFDIVVCGDVLEHVPHPDRALDNLFRAVKPGGKVHLSFPNRRSPKARVAKLTPLRFHVWAYRRMGMKRAGLPGFPPYKLYLKRSMDPQRVKRQAEAAGLEAESIVFEETGALFRPLLERTIPRLAIKVLWLGRAQPSDCRMTLVKR